MSSSLEHPIREPVRCQPRWSARVEGTITEMSLAREVGWLLVQTDLHWLSLLDAQGRTQAQLRGPTALSCSSAADDGSAYVAGGVQGDVWWLAPDLSIRWTRRLPQKVAGLALDGLGEHLLVADGGGGLTLFTNRGETEWQTSTPRPLRHLTFVPEVPHLIGSADYGLVQCLDAKGRCVWRDGLVASVGGMAIRGDGGRLALACYSDGVYRYTRRGERSQWQGLPEPVRQVRCSYDGRMWLVLGLGGRVWQLARENGTPTRVEFDGHATGLALSPLGDNLLVSFAKGQITSYQLD